MSIIDHNDRESPHLSGRRSGGFADDPDDPDAPRDPEITLGTMTVLGIFFGLAVLCAGFFGFGYSVALRRAASTNASVTAPQPVSVANAPIPKPAPGSPSVPVDTSLTDAITAPKPTESVEPPASPTGIGSTGKTSAARVVVPAAGESPAVASATPPPSTAKEPTRAAARIEPAVVAPGGLPTILPPVQGTQTMVQVAALTRPEDAQIVVSALKSKGYDATVHNSPQDRFLHVQVGPFSNKKDAEAMRQRILADGFNAMLK